MKHISESVPGLAKQMAANQVRPIGTIAFMLSSGELFNENARGGVIFEASSGAHVFRLVRENAPVISYYHWSPGTGGRVASVDLTKTTATMTVQVAFNWHPKKIQLFVTPIGISGAKHLIAEGQATDRTFRVNKLGEIVQVGDEGVKLLDIRMEIDGIPIILPTAHENWQATEEACEVLQRGQSDDGYMFEVVKDNSVLTKLVTGFETYCKTRIIELEKEGVQPNLQQLSKILSLASEEKDALINKSGQIAREKNISILELWLVNQRRVNFQEFDKAKSPSGDFMKDYRVFGA